MVQLFKSGPIKRSGLCVVTFRHKMNQSCPPYFSPEERVVITERREERQKLADIFIIPLMTDVITDITDTHISLISNKTKL